MSEQLRFSPSMTWQNSAWISPDQYQKMYQESVANPEKFWGDQAKILDWFKPWDRVKSTSFQKPVHIQWYQGGELNVAYNCIDRHLSTKKNQPAIIWEPDSPSEPAKTITYDELSASVAKFCHILKKYGVKKGDRVTIYLPMIPEAAFAMLACARMGAIHNVVFGGFSPDSLADRILDSESDFLITANEGLRAGKTIPLKANADLALKKCPQVRHCLVVKRTESEVPWTPGRDIPYNSELAKAPSEFPAESFSSETPLFILYTSGSTNKPKGVLHTSGGYLVYAALTHKFVFDYKPGDIYWCTADVGWVTGHSYMIYGPLANGATTLLFEGVPTWPQASRIWEVVDKHKVNILYTAPTLIRSLISLGDHHVTKTSRKSLKLLGSVGEPINPEAWLWYHDKVGESRCPVVDTWWQTETGGILITPLPGVSTLKPGSATRPFFGIQPAVLNDKGQEVSGAAEGVLVIKDSWPGQMRTVYKDHARFEETYFSAYPGYYFSGDGCRRDEDGDFWITGRVDDVLNVSGHRMGTAEIESALDAHPGVAETAVVGFPHDIKGQGIYCYVTLVHGVQPSDELKAELQNFVRDEIGPIAKPDVIQWAPALPKTRSGKIMRRILRKIAEKRFDQLGDTSTLADPAVVEDLIRNRPS